MNEKVVAMPRARSSRREQNKAENRTALVKAARAVFAEMGYGAASVRDIVRRTDLASGTFYNYFKDKDEIFEAVVGELTGEILRRHNAGRARATTAEDFMRRHYAVYFDFIAEDAELLAMARRNFTAIRTLLDKPDWRRAARWRRWPAAPKSPLIPCTIKALPGWHRGWWRKAGRRTEPSKPCVLKTHRAMRSACSGTRNMTGNVMR